MTRAFRRAAVEAVRQLDHSLGRHLAGRRVLVDVRTPMNLAVLRPIWKHLLEDPRVTVQFIGEPGTGVGPTLAAEGLGEALISHDTAEWSRFDLAMTSDLWNHSRLRRCRKRINFFHGVAGKYDLDDPQALRAAAAFERLDRLAFINRDRLDRYVSSGVIRPDQAVLVGFPKMDDLVNGAWSRESVRSELGLSPSVETVLYAPTFSTANSLHLGGEAIVDTMLASGRNVIVKLHDRSMVPHPKYTAGIDWPARLARFETNPRFVLARASDIGPFLAAADLLVTDHSTVGFEFALLDRPIVVFDAPGLVGAARIDREKWTLLRSMAVVVKTPDDLQLAVDTELAHPGHLRKERERAHTLFAHAGRATERGLAVVYELLELALPVLRSGDRRSAADDEPRGHLGNLDVA